MSNSPESTPHITKARKHLVDCICELREARLAHEAEPVDLARRSQMARDLDADLETDEVR